MLARIVSRDSWIRPSARLRPWIDALRAADRGNKTLLVRLLHSSDPIPKEARPLIVDLLRRSKLTVDRRKTPAYDLTRRVVQLNAAHDAVLRTKKAGKIRPGRKLDALIEQKARQFGVDKEALIAHLAGKNASARRMMKRLKAAGLGP
jgi:hypothetical protein